MTAMFAKPKIPQAEKAKAPPSVDDAQMRIEESRRRRKGKGRSSTQVVGKETAVATAAKALTGN